MSQLISVHLPGEIIWTLGNDGVLRAFNVLFTGAIDPMDAHLALDEDAKQ